MPLILVVEQEQRYIERISEALSSYGWAVEGVRDRESALEHVDDGPVDLLVVASDVSGASELLATFVRRAGGPGAVLLVPENPDKEVAELEADEVVQKPFTAKAIRQAVRRCLADEAKRGGDGSTGEPQAVSTGVSSGSGANGSAGSVAAGVAAGGDPGKAGSGSLGALLTSEDIFGDVVSELESALSGGVATAAPAEEEDTTSDDAEVVEEMVLEAEAPAAEVSAEEPPTEELPAGEASSEEVAEASSNEEEQAAEAQEQEVEPVAAEAESEEAPETEDAKAAAEETDAEGAEPGARPAPPRLDPAKVLEERIRQAAEEGKRLAARSTPGLASGAAESADELLREVMPNIGPTTESTAAPARATREEIDALLSSVVKTEVPAETRADSPAEASEAAAGSETPGGPESAREPEPVGEAPVVDEPVLIEGLAPIEPAHSDLSPALEVFGENANRGLGAGMKLALAIVIIVVLAIVAFVVSGQIGSDVAPATPPGGAAVTPLEPVTPTEEPAPQSDEGETKEEISRRDTPTVGTAPSFS